MNYDTKRYQINTGKPLRKFKSKKILCKILSEHH